jgi:DNA-binding GntR family transcriptional regulator
MQLESEGLVHFEAHKGATVSELSADQVDEVFELRALLECDVLKRAIPHLKEEDFEQAEQLLQEMEDAMKNGDMIAATGELNAKFHNILYSPADRPQTLELIETLYKNCSRFVRMHIILAGGIDTAPNEHKELLNLCKKGKKSQAATFLKSHILSARDDVKAYLVKSESQQEL